MARSPKRICHLSHYFIPLIENGGGPKDEGNNLDKGKERKLFNN